MGARLGVQIPLGLMDVGVQIYLRFLLQGGVCSVYVVSAWLDFRVVSEASVASEASDPQMGFRWLEPGFSLVRRPGITRGVHRWAPL